MECLKIRGTLSWWRGHFRLRRILLGSDPFIVCCIQTLPGAPRILPIRRLQIFFNLVPSFPGIQRAMWDLYVLPLLWMSPNSGAVHGTHSVSFHRLLCGRLLSLLEQPVTAYLYRAPHVAKRCADFWNRACTLTYLVLVCHVARSRPIDFFFIKLLCSVCVLIECMLKTCLLYICFLWATYSLFT